MNIFQTMFILISLLISVSQSTDTSNYPNCDFVVKASQNLYEPIGVCIAMGDGQSYRTDYDESRGAVHLRFYSTDCTGESQEYTESNDYLSAVNVGTGNLCKTYGAYWAYHILQKPVFPYDSASSETAQTTEQPAVDEGGYEEPSESSESADVTEWDVIEQGNGFETQLFGFCTLIPSVQLFQIVDYCRNGILRGRWFYDDACTEGVQKENFVTVNEGNDDIEWKSLMYYRAYGAGDVRRIMMNEDETEIHETRVTDIVCVSAQNNNRKHYSSSSSETVY